MLRRLFALAAVCAATPALAAPSIALTSGAPSTFTLPAGQFTNDFYIDVTNETRLKLALTANDDTADVDLLLRYGSPFPDTTSAGLAPSSDYLFEHAQYRSASADGNETLDISTYNRQPVRAGRWYVSIVSFADRAVNATLTATASNDAVPALPIELVFDDASADGEPCDIAPWSDATARPPVAGNTATTLGAQRRAALTEAARLLSNELKSPVPLRVQACWADLGAGNAVTLAQAGPQGFYVSDPFLNTDDDGYVAGSSVLPWLPRNYTWYASGPASKLAGVRLCEAYGACAGGYDVRIEFNTKVDTVEALGPAGFHYGIASGPTNGDVDFITVAMHEITHGLGFAGLVEKGDEGTIGARALGYDDIYDANVVRLVGNCSSPTGCTQAPFLSGTDADRAAALTSISGLRWGDAAATASNLNPNRALQAPLNLVPLYAPNPIAGGSTLSHLQNAVSPGGLMLPQIAGTTRQLGLAAPMLDAVGWSNAARAAPADIDPFSAQYFDVARSGHGIDFSRTALPGDVYVLTFYTYGADGEPEWYLAFGPMVDGVFMPAPNANGDSLVRYKYVPGSNPPQVADATVSGTVRLDFNGAANSPACNDGEPNRDLGTRTAVMTWSIGADRNRQWCMQPLFPDAARTLPDYTGTWSSPGDPGWGFSLLTAGSNLFGLVYYPDAQGNGRWAYVQTANFGSGTQYQLFERKGYCRTCAKPAGFDDKPAGNVTLSLTSPRGQGNRAKLDVTYQNAPGGKFERDRAISPLTDTRE